MVPPIETMTMLGLAKAAPTRRKKAATANALASIRNEVAAELDFVSIIAVGVAGTGRRKNGQNQPETRSDRPFGRTSARRRLELAGDAELEIARQTGLQQRATGGAVVRHEVLLVEYVAADQGDLPLLLRPEDRGGARVVFRNGEQVGQIGGGRHLRGVSRVPGYADTAVPVVIQEHG